MLYEILLTDFSFIYSFIYLFINIQSVTMQLGTCQKKEKQISLMGNVC